VPGELGSNIPDYVPDYAVSFDAGYSIAVPSRPAFTPPGPRVIAAPRLIFLSVSVRASSATSVS